MAKITSLANQYPYTFYQKNNLKQLQTESATISCIIRHQENFTSQNHP